MKKMKTKTKILAIVEIAIMLCSLFLVAIPAIAAEQTTQKAITTASGDDYVLEIYGNANEDDTIDMGDVVYTKLAIFGKKPKTELCDAKYDGRINVLDVIQTKLIILGKEKEITVVDDKERIVTIKKQIKRAVVGYRFTSETLRSIGVSKDQIVGVPNELLDRYGWAIYFPEFKDVPGIGTWSKPDCEAILNLNPDIVFLTASSRLDAPADILELAGIHVLRFYSSGSLGGLGSLESYPEEITKFGYIFDKKNEAEEFCDWYEGVLNAIKEKVENIPEKDKPKVYCESNKAYFTVEQRGRIWYAGGKNIFETEEKSVKMMKTKEIDPEAVIGRNPDIIVKFAPSGTITGYHLDSGDTTEVEKVREEVMSRPELQNVKAVKDRRVYVIAPWFLAGGGDSGARNFLGIVYMAKWFHPDIFKDVDPQAIHQEYLTRFQGLDIDLDEKGVFVYHPEEHPHGN